MKKLVLDTNVLIKHWRKSRGETLADKTTEDAAAWGRVLGDVQRTKAILTPVYIEFVCGVTNGHEMDLARAYLDHFEIIDEGHITAADWVAARRMAERIPADSKR